MVCCGTEGTGVECRLEGGEGEGGAWLEVIKGGLARSRCRSTRGLLKNVLRLDI